MKTLQINKNSWHYYIVDTYGPGFGYCDNLCNYGRRVIKGLMSMLASMIMMALLLSCVVDTCIWLYVGITMRFVMINFMGFVGIVLICAIMYALVMDWWHENLDKQSRDRIQAIQMGIAPRTRGIVTQWYHSVKGKYCARVELQK
jgi:MFS family permease